MCESCMATLCYEGCPFYEENASGAVCEACGERLSPGAVYYTRETLCLCETCVEQLTLNDLLDLGDLRGIGDLLSLLGYQRAS